MFRKDQKQRYLAIFFMLFCGLGLAQAQNARLSGKIIEKGTQLPMSGVNVVISGIPDSTVRYFSVTDQTGGFSISGLKFQTYKLRITFLGYSEITRTIEVNKRFEPLGILWMEETAKAIDEVVFQGQVPPVILNGDTTEMNASAYKTNPDANAEDLIKKMPGIIVENGSVKAQGEDVKRVLVDGKLFFGDDPAIALQNLPADIIDKVQVFDKMSEQSEFTGFDDGNTSKTINIITKQNRRYGYFGKLSAGTDFDEKYAAGGNVNLFQNQRRFSVIGLTNNVNQQNFSTQDLLGVMGENPGRNNRSKNKGAGSPQPGSAASNFLVGQQNGISTTNSFGLNYSDNFKNKLQVSSSYFYNQTQNTSIEVSDREYLLSPGPNRYYNEDNHSGSNNANHRFSMKLEWDIDSFNSLIFTPRINLQDNNSQRNLSGINLYNTEDIINQSHNVRSSESGGYNLGTGLVLRHKFHKVGRTISTGFTISANNKDQESTQQAIISTYRDLDIEHDSTDRRTDGLTKGYSLSANLGYTEPIGNNSLILLNYNVSFNRSDADKKTFDLAPSDVDTMVLNTNLSNLYGNDYISNRAGLGYRFHYDKINISAGLDYQRADMFGDQKYPSLSKVDKVFDDFLPNFLLTYKFSKRNNLKISYRASTNAPSILQLQNVIDESNPLKINAGNPYLRQETNYSVSARYQFANVEKSTHYFIFLAGSKTSNDIGNATYFASKDTLIINGIKVSPGRQLTMPINLDDSYNFRSMFTFGFLLKPIMSNISLVTGFNYSQKPGYINQQMNRSTSLTPNASIVLSSNISENVDFTVSYQTNYSIVKNSSQIGLNNTYWNNSANLRFNWIFLNSFVFQTNVMSIVNRGLSSDFNKDYYLWNASFGKKFLKNQPAELKASVFDLLDQNDDINRSVSPTYIEDSRVNTIRRYFMVTFTYNLKNYKAPNTRKDKSGKRKSPKNQFEP